MNKTNIQKKLLNFIVFWDLLTLQRSKSVNPQKVLKKQNKRIKKLVKSAYANPFYKERFDRAGVKPEDINCAEDLLKLPPLTKDELRSWMAQLSEDPRYAQYYHDSTSGSTGKPLEILYSPSEKAYNMANWFRVLLLNGCNPFFLKTLTRVDVHSVTGKNKSKLELLGLLRRDFIQQYIPEQEMIDKINESKPDILSLNKAEFMRIALYCINNNIELHKPRFYTPIGEKIDENSKRILKRVYGDGLIDAYGSAETGSVMSRMIDEDFYYVNNDLFALNFVDADGKAADEGKVLITPLFRTDIPLINYEIGDSAASFKKDSLTYVRNINGRINDFFILENGKIISFFEVAPIINHYKSLDQIKFIQRSYTDVTVQYVKSNDPSAATAEETEKYLLENLNRIFGSGMNFEFVKMDSIPADKSGKLRVVVNEVK